MQRQKKESSYERVGGMWENVNEWGKKYFTIVFNVVNPSIKRYIAIENTHSDHPQAPQYLVCIKRDIPNQHKRRIKEEEEDEDIPF